MAIRSMAKAVYETENIGHYGLAFEHYTHFTSPIRRYADLVIHRILHSAVEKRKNPYEKGLESICKHISANERRLQRQKENQLNIFKPSSFRSILVRYLKGRYQGLPIMECMFV
jgi:ribonuclease R